MREKERNIFISNKDLTEAKDCFFNKVNDFEAGFEKVEIAESVGRITYNCIYARVSSPHYNCSAMDGIAVLAEKTYNATEINPKILYEGEDFEYINTGSPLNDVYDAVIMIEDVIREDDASVRIISPAFPWQHVRIVGEDIAAGEMVLPSKHRIRPQDLGALLSAGVPEIEVYKKPEIGILPTGSEIIEEIRQPAKGEIIDSNSRVFEALVKSYGGVPRRYSPCIDEMGALKQAIEKGIMQNDILLINAGSSAGQKDFVHHILSEMGEILVHGIAIKPGKPTILAIVNGKPVIGIPGYPVSSYLVFEIFARPLVLKYSDPESDYCEETENTIRAFLSRRVVSSFKNMEFIRVTVGHINGRFIATPLMRGAGATMSLVRADGFLTVLQNIEGIEAGQEIDVKLIKSEKRIKNTLVSIGSHDMIMDEIADLMPLSSAHSGSMGGITAMKRNECHIAPIHLLDEISGEYNLPYIKKHFKGKKMALIKGVRRTQGLMVQCGNPLNIQGFECLCRKEVKFINRQKGSGTRILLDYNLRCLNIDTSRIQGYEKEMNNHMAVAAVVASGSADAGPGIASAARNMGLSFIPVGHENYDFLTYMDFLEDERVKRFISVLRSSEFAERLKKIGGYCIKEAGEIIMIAP